MGMKTFTVLVDMRTVPGLEEEGDFSRGELEGKQRCAGIVVS